MTTQYLIKLATSKPQVPQQRFVQPLAQVIAQQHGVNPEHLKNRDMSAALAQLTDYAMRKGYSGACNAVASQHRQFAPNVWSSDYVKGKGPRGACDYVAATHSIQDKEPIKGEGQKALEICKFKDIRSFGGGRNGGGSLG